ncbi:hypothetical protein PHLGIDRAFT_122676 [Phlebiopsis gigantea 11061_1 CR5-6]|uniref:Uncharacterized protein n=1 Tax=Phlebiopsis gigantea (strain 11061_1 CR5-6) TaxID=745531 RepID=A0A0C3NCE4_PHLG1|nr:hypothetical protein PHLGIDRAFT_122676 [Phlebiopsis gigantea 11061_1 CR5-6]
MQSLDSTISALHDLASAAPPLRLTFNPDFDLELLAGHLKIRDCSRPGTVSYANLYVRKGSATPFGVSVQEVLAVTEFTEYGGRRYRLTINDRFRVCTAENRRLELLDICKDKASRVETMRAVRIAPKQFHTPMDSSFPTLDFPGLYIPQGAWVPAFGPTEDLELMPPVLFKQNGRQGVNLGDAFRCNFNGMLDGHLVPHLAPGFGVIIRINWPGYEPWHKYIIAIKNNKFIDKARIAYEVAKAVHDFYSEMGHGPGTASARDWRPEVVPFEQLVLMELQHVGGNSWQPVLVFANALA